MRKVFTYSRKRPFSRFLATKKDSAEAEKENGSGGAALGDSPKSSKDTPQTKRQKDIHTLLRQVDRKLSFLSELQAANGSSQDFSKFYRHKNWFLSQAEGQQQAPTGLGDLFHFLKQESAVSFSEWLQCKLQQARRLEKLSEATFSEVFRFTSADGAVDNVVKIVPLQIEPAAASEETYPLPISVDSALHECTVLKTVSSLKEYRTQASPLCWTGFNQIRELVVVEGCYPSELTKAWDRWKRSHRCENASPRRYQSDAKFLVVTMEYGGVDLETFQPRSFAQVASIIRQLVCALDLAEEKLELEHRDLHLGNVLVRETEAKTFRPGPDAAGFAFEGVQCSIIDFSLARMRGAGGKVAFRDLDSIAWLFEGDADISSQYQVYKDMRALHGSNRGWEAYCPQSNMLWLGYLVSELVEGKRAPKRNAKQKAQIDELRALRDRIPQYSSVRALRAEDAFFGANKAF